MRPASLRCGRSAIRYLTRLFWELLRFALPDTARAGGAVVAAAWRRRTAAGPRFQRRVPGRHWRRKRRCAFWRWR